MKVYPELTSEEKKERILLTSRDMMKITKDKELKQVLKDLIAVLKSREGEALEEFLKWFEKEFELLTR